MWKRNIVNSVVQVLNKSAMSSINHSLFSLLGLAARFGILHSSKMGFSFEQQLVSIRDLLNVWHL